MSTSHSDPRRLDIGIWPPYEAFYIEAMLSNTRSAVASIEWAGDALDAQDTTLQQSCYRLIGGLSREFYHQVWQH